MGERESDEGLVLDRGFSSDDELRSDACIVISSGQRLGARFDVAEKADKADSGGQGSQSDGITLGTEKDCDIPLSDGSVSGIVVEVSRVDQGLLVRRREGEGLLLVAGAEVEEATLGHGQRFQLGETVLTVLTSSDLELEYRDLLYWLATHDVVTDLFNKRYLLESLDRQMSRARRWNTPFSVAVFQLSHLELSERSAGRGHRDVRVHRLAQALLRYARIDDVVARVDDVTFASALYRTHPDGAEILCSRICASLLLDDFRPKVAVAALDATSPQKGVQLLSKAIGQLSNGGSKGSDE